MELDELHAIAKTMTPDQWCRLWVDVADGRDVGLALPAFPDPATQRITNNTSGAATMEGAAVFYKIADEEISRRFNDPAQCRLLDYGAGWGRITRLLLRSIHPANLFAVDVDPRLVEAGKAALPALSFQLIESGTAFPFADRSFDIAVANSVLSHLSEDAHNFCIGEITRILRPGGLFLGTTLGLKHFEGWLEVDASRKWITSIMTDHAAVRRSIAAGRFVFGPTGRWPHYGIAVLPEGWAAAHWKPGLDIVATRTDYTQDVQVAVKTLR